MIQSTILTKATPHAVWALWKKRHPIVEDFRKGLKGRATNRSNLSYEVLEVVEGSHFKILWKSFLTRLVFTHSVKKLKKGSEICYQVHVRGFFSWPIELLLKRKIEKNLHLVLRSFANDLQQDRS